MYNFGEKGTSSKYEAHSDNDVLVLLDCTPDQSMLDEGTAREVVNRIQKLRKKAGLQPQDEVTLYYQVNPKEHDLLRVINDHVYYIETSTKNPLVLETPGNLTEKLAEEKYELKGAELTLSLVKGFHKDGFKNTSDVENKSQVLGYGQTKGKYVNIAHKDMVVTVLLDNPHNENNSLSYNQLCDEATNVLGMTSPTVKLFLKGVEISQTNVSAIVGKTLTTDPSITDRFDAIAGSACPFVEVKYKNKTGTLLLENPVGCEVTSYANEVLSAIFGVSLHSCKKFKTGKDTLEINCMIPAQWKTLYGKSVDLLL